MTREEFWQTVDSTRPKGFWAALHAGYLEMKLATLPEEEIISFDHHFRQVMDESYRWDLWGAAYIVNGGCSDDGFEYPPPASSEAGGFLIALPRQEAAKMTRESYLAKQSYHVCRSRYLPTPLTDTLPTHEHGN